MGMAPHAMHASFQSLLHQGISLLQARADVGYLVRLAFQSLLHQGISLLGAGPDGCPGSSPPAFQSLLHQGISLLASASSAAGRGGRGRFQSLLHQGISLLAVQSGLSRAAVVPTVSIPSSSGHQFTGYQPHLVPVPERWSFNPFFIRASVYCPATWSCALRAQVAFQSLLHQGISLLQVKKREGRRRRAAVSIPSSSGHQFTVQVFRTEFRRGDYGFNPFFIRASVYWDFLAMEIDGHADEFQSLLHQGISLLLFDVRVAMLLADMFQSLLHQGISLLLSSFLSIPPSFSRFQSLLHQGISLLNGAYGPKIRCMPCFNPFFIRASVY